MKDKMKQVWQQILEFFAKLGKKTKVLMVAALVAVIVGIVAFSVAASNPSYTVLFTGLTSTDMQSVLTYLEENAVTKYQVRNNDTILVPENQESSLKAKLLMQGYPTSGFSYSTYLDNVGALSTESDRQTLYLYELQNRMGAVIRCFDGVQDATVTITPGEDRRFVLDSSNVLDAKASVFVSTEPGQKLSNQQATAIQSLMARSVKGLNIDSVTITDSQGNSYSGGEDATLTDGSQLKLTLEAQVNNTVRTNILQVLTPLFGVENVSVGVNSTVDVSKTFGESVSYTEPAWAADGSTGGEGIIGSKVYDNTIIRDGNNAAGGVVGTETNSDLNTYVEQEAQPDGTEQEVSTSGEINYNVNTDKVQTERSAGVVTDLMVSVSINSTVAENLNTVELLHHVAKAAGIGTELEGDKISILAMPFYQPQSDGVVSLFPLADWMVYALAAGLVLFVLLLIIFLLLRKKRKKKKGKQQNAYSIDAAAFQAAMEPMGADIMDIRTERSMALRKDVRQFAEGNPEIAAQMVKSWLRGGEENSGR